MRALAPLPALAAAALVAATGCASVPVPWRAPDAPSAPPLAGESASLPAPEGLRATSGELRAVPLHWEPLLVGDVGGYVVERAASRGGPFERVAVVAGRLSTQFIDRDTIPAGTAPAEPIDVAAAPEGEDAVPANHEDGVTWFYRARAFAPDGSVGVVTSPVVVATTAPPPGPPEDLRAYSRQPREVPLSWRASDDPLVAGYLVERSPTARGPFELLARIDGRYQTAHVDRGLGDLRVFYYRVTAVNPAGGLGQPTDPVQAVTKPEPLPPVALEALERQIGRNVIAWDPNVEPDIVRYRVTRIRADGDSELVAEVPQDQTWATDDAVGAGERVAYRVEAIDRDGLVSAPSRSIEVDSVDYGLEARVEADGVHLSWNPRDGEGFLGAHVSREGRVQRTHLGFSSDGRFVDPDVAPGGHYAYTVVLEHADETLAPRSERVDVQVPDGDSTR